MVLTGFSDVEAIIQAINKGRVYRYITKPWNRDELKITIDRALEAYDLKQQNKKLIEDLKKANQNLEQKVIQRTKQIEQQKIEITDSIHYASRIQSALLPPDEDLGRLLPSYFVLNKPRDIVSGDFYWIKEVKDHLLIVAADCTGHGVPGAFVSMMGMALLNDIVTDENVTKANQVLEELRKRVKSSLKQTGMIDEQKDGMDMALCAINLKTEVMQFSGANIPLYLHRNGEINVFKPVSNPIGISHKEIPFENQVIELKTGDLFYMFSDGLIDQFHHHTKEKFKTIRLNDLINNIHELPLSQQYEAFEKTYTEWTGNPDNQTDDILVMGFRIT
jgi:serine phosphatase RsbU (regulator of sigma subunit)